MPGHQKQMGSLDVQFGNWESSAETSLFSFGSDSSVSKSMPSTLASRLIIKLCLLFYCKRMVLSKEDAEEDLHK